VPLFSGRTLDVSSRGTVKLRMKCADMAHACVGRIMLDAARTQGRARSSRRSRRSRRVVIGRASVSLGAGQTKTIVVRLSRNGRRRVLRERKLRCRATMVSRGANGTKRVTRAHLMLKAPRR
jgi:hypothetical protein